MSIKMSNYYVWRWKAPEGAMFLECATLTTSQRSPSVFLQGYSSPSLHREQRK